VNPRLPVTIRMLPDSWSPPPAGIEVCEVRGSEGRAWHSQGDYSSPSSQSSLMARTATSLMRDHLLPKLQQLYRSRPVQYQQVDDTQNNNYSSVNNNLLDVSTGAHPSLTRWQRWGRNLVTFNCMFVPTPRQYVEIPRTPSQTHTHTHSTHTQYYQEPTQSDNLDECSSGGGCTTASPAHSLSTYRPFEQLVLSA